MHFDTFAPINLLFWNFTQLPLIWTLSPVVAYFTFSISPFGERYVGKDEPARELEGLIAGKLGIAVRVQMILKEDIPVRRDRLAQVQVQEETLQKLRQHINMPIEISAE